MPRPRAPRERPGLGLGHNCARNAGYCRKLHSIAAFIVRHLYGPSSAPNCRATTFPGLQRFVLTDVRPTGKQLGAGSYGSVEELEVNGLVCAGKRLHDALLDRENAGVANIERRYLEECQVIQQMRFNNFSCKINVLYIY